MLTKRIFPPATRKFGALDYLISTTIFALALTLIFLFSCAFLGVIAFKMPNPLKFTSALAYIALYLSAFSSSFIISKKNGQKYLLCALFNASFLFFSSRTIPPLPTPLRPTSNCGLISEMKIPPSFIKGIIAG